MNVVSDLMVVDVDVEIGGRPMVVWRAGLTGFDIFDAFDGI